MAQNADSRGLGLTPTEELSPVKRALVEIRQLRAELDATQRGYREPVAIAGMAMRFPGGVTTPERFWQALCEGEDLIGPISPERWDAREYLHADQDQAGTMYDPHGGFLSDVDAFDAEFFGINQREAASMDPQQRILLELTWEALERAAIQPKSLFNKSAGVFLGLSNCDYARQTMRDLREIDAYTGVGGSLSITAGRISYFLGTQGPALVVDTACSASLVALHLAVQSLRRKEIDLAIVGAANLILSPELNVGFSRTRMLSPSGRSKTFDAAADGYVRSEGCGVVVLKRLADARQDGDPVIAIVAGSAINQDGRSAGLTAPNGPAQEKVIRAALEDASLPAAAISFVEAHGTGTPLGDPMEIQAMSAVYGVGRAATEPLRTGSVKTNLGHTEAAAGLAGLMKVVLMMQPGHGIVPQLHFRNPNPKIDWAHLPIEVPTAFTPWPATGRALHAGVSSFGFSGTNAHVILTSPEGDCTKNSHAAEPDGQQELLLVLSAMSAETLRQLAGRYVPFLRQSSLRFADICFTALTGRTTFEYRLALRASNAVQAAELLEQWLAGNAVEGVAVSGSQELSQIAGDTLGGMAADFVRSGTLAWQALTNLRAVRSGDLPVYPFRRTRFWAGPAPREERRHRREQTWQAAIRAAETQSLQGPLGWNVGDYAKKWEALHQLTLAHAQNALIETGALAPSAWLLVDDVITRSGIQPLYRNLVKRWLDGLAAAGRLATDGDRFRASFEFKPVNLEPYWVEAERQLSDNPGLLAYLRHCGSMLPQVVTGKTSPLETLFPQGSFSLAQGVYETTPEARYLNPIVAAAVNQVVRSIGPRRNARILEIGGGTGGTTSAILPTLPVGQLDYWFTDVSELFLNRARGRFSAFPFMHYAIFDLDRPLPEQGIAAGQFDVVLGANVVHAARNLAAASETIQQLLAPGGLMVLLEATTHHSWFDMTTGLIEGWQHFEDDLRQKHPLLDPEQWRELLEQNGFSPVMTLPADGSPVSGIGQHVVIARSTRDELRDDATEIPVLAASDWGVAAPSIASDSASDFAAIWSTLAPPERETATFDFVRSTIRRVFNLARNAEELSRRDRLSDLGMDSLIALELKAQLAKGSGLGKRISSTIAFDTGTVGELAAALLSAMEAETYEADLPREPDDAKNNLATQKSEANSQLSEAPMLSADDLSAMSEEEVEKLLSERLMR
jgi:3-oxoacyl-(acyl-carrier-protein) synthase/SAM-dependent methyltransferase